MKLLLINILLLTIYTGFAQDFVADYKQMRDVFASVQRVQIDMTMRFYKSNTATEPMYTKTSSFCKDSSSYYYAYNNTEVLTTPEATIAVHTKEKTLLYTPEEGRKKKDDIFSHIVAPDIDSAIARYTENINYKGSRRGIKHYTIFFPPEQYIVELEYFIDEKTHMPTQMVYYYNTENQQNIYKIDIKFNINTKPEYEPMYFSPQRYVSMENNTIHPKPKYAGYDVQYIQNK